VAFLVYGLCVVEKEGRMGEGGYPKPLKSMGGERLERANRRPSKRFYRIIKLRLTERTTGIHNIFRCNPRTSTLKTP
jgi:hypothetical protein